METKELIGKIIKHQNTDEIKVDIKNKISINDLVEILPPSGPVEKGRIVEIFDKKRVSIEHAQPNTHSTLKVKRLCNSTGIVRKAYFS